MDFYEFCTGFSSRPTERRRRCLLLKSRRQKVSPPSSSSSSLLLPPLSNSGERVKTSLRSITAQQLFPYMEWIGRGGGDIPAIEKWEGGMALPIFVCPTVADWECKFQLFYWMLSKHSACTQVPPFSREEMTEALDECNRRLVFFPYLLSSREKNYFFCSLLHF